MLVRFFKLHWPESSVAVVVLVLILAFADQSSVQPPPLATTPPSLSDGRLDNGLMDDKKLAEVLRSKKVVGTDTLGVTLLDMQPPLSQPVKITMAYYADRPGIGMDIESLSVTQVTYVGDERIALRAPTGNCSFIAVVFIGNNDLLASEIPRRQPDGSLPAPQGRALLTFDDSKVLDPLCSASSRSG